MKSAGAAAMRSTSASPISASTASRISDVRSTRTRRAPGGGASDTGPLTRTTSAPRRAASRARAYPIFPELRFERNRTGSTGSRVGPAVTRTRRPSSERETTPASRIARAMRAGGASRPGPTSPQARSPASGSTTVAPRDLRIARFSSVAGWAHIHVFIAGARTSALRCPRAYVVRASSPIPRASFARTSAVAGAIARTSAQRASAMWSTAPDVASQRSATTGLFERTASVSGVMKRVAAGVMRTRTSAPPSTRARTISADLYAEIPPLTPRTM